MTKEQMCVDRVYQCTTCMFICPLIESGNIRNGKGTSASSGMYKFCLLRIRNALGGRYPLVVPTPSPLDKTLPMHVR